MKRRPARLVIGLVGVLLLLGLQLRGAAALRLLFAPLAGANSPALDLLGVAAHLRARGHDVAVLTSPDGLAFSKKAAARHSSNTTAEALRYLTYAAGDAGAFERQVGELLRSLGGGGRKLSSLGGPRLLLKLQEMLSKPCGALLRDAATMAALKAERFDGVAVLGIPAADGADWCGCILAHALGARVVTVTGVPLLSGPPSVPQFGSRLTPADLATWRGWLKNRTFWAFKNLMVTAASELGLLPWAALRREAGLPPARGLCPLTNALAALLGQERRSCEPAVDVILGSWLFEYPRPLEPWRVMVGPGSPRAPRPIEPPEVAAFVDGAPHDAAAAGSGGGGVVLVAFGTTVQARVVMGREDWLALAAAFSALAPTRVVWALRDDALPDGLALADLNLGANVLTTPWVDYNDVLGHRNTRAVVTHAGLHSAYEVMFHGVPIVAVPFQQEQAENAAKLAHRGLGVVCEQAPAVRATAAARGGETAAQHFTAARVEALVRGVMDPRNGYARRAAAASLALRTYAARRHPYARAADAIELALETAAVLAARSPAGSSSSDDALLSAPPTLPVLEIEVDGPAPGGGVAEPAASLPQADLVEAAIDVRMPAAAAPAAAAAAAGGGRDGRGGGGGGGGEGEGDGESEGDAAAAAAMAAAAAEPAPGEVGAEARRGKDEL